MFLAALFTVVKVLKQPQCLSTDEGIKMWYVCVYVCVHTYTYIYIYMAVNESFARDILNEKWCEILHSFFLAFQAQVPSISKP